MYKPKLIPALLILLISCSTSPTGRRQMTLLPESQLASMGGQSFDEMKRQKPLSRNRQHQRKVECITNALLLSMNENPKEWEIAVFEDKSPNAFALPGKKMGVHTGMFSVAKNNAQLAAVIGHEIGHVLAKHGNERVSQQLTAQLAVAGASIALGQDSQTDQLILAGLGLGAQFGVLLPFSRTHEREADQLGLTYMARAGFDPREASKLWQNMSQGSKGAPPELLSTHPSPDSRIRDLAALAPAHMDEFKKAPKPNCPL